jgi:hypothetical protein
MNQFSRIILLLLAVFLAAPAAGQHRGENLLQTFPIPEDGWEMARKEDGQEESVRWQRSEGKDRFITTVRRGSGNYPASRFRRASDDAGEANCKDFQSTTIDDTEVNGYERQMWKALCNRAERDPLVVLHLYITGRDSGYYLHRTWHGEPPESTLEEWENYLKSVSVCDTRARRKAPCPELTPVTGRGDGSQANLE